MLHTWYSVVVAKLQYKYIIVELTSSPKNIFLGIITLIKLLALIWS